MQRRLLRRGGLGTMSDGCVARSGFAGDSAGWQSFLGVRSVPSTSFPLTSSPFPFVSLFCFPLHPLFPSAG